jgi:ABC-2 type transport system ATP-binding protein
MSGLDPKARIQLKNMLLDYLQNNEKTIFFSSHILSDIEEICHRIAVIHEGRLIFLGTCARYKSLNNQTTLEQAFIKSISKSYSNI